MVAIVCGLAKANQPVGLLRLGLKFLMELIDIVKSTEILNYRQTHMALF